ncbi:interleukin-1 receptor-like 1 [Chelmon rostratus]|uniref:interleukin-1 receptor-like 1 n=1 Tax=Chelmon rostratus TaxID=109905 RepID=UPI001BE63E73|nr:interleukin-1 receptor-like 1 [Chelmon rostratus]
MDSCQLLSLVFMLISTSECSETAEPQCEDFDVESFNLLEGEAFYFVPYVLPDGNLPDEQITWYKNHSISQTKPISPDKNKRVHYHGGVLLFLNLQTEDSGLYTARHETPSGKCYNYFLKVAVYKNKTDAALLYGQIKNSDQNKKVPCPDPVRYTCEVLKGTLTWKKDFKLLQGQHKADLWVSNATEAIEGIYTCTCTWTYNDKQYKSSGSRRLKDKEQIAHRKPEIISPTDKELFADEGVEIKLSCSVFCGTNVARDCNASWHVHGIPFNNKDGYTLTSQITVDNPSKNTIATAVLTIERVSAEDFQTEFKCIGVGFYTVVSDTYTLKRRESIIPLVTGRVCVLFLFIFSAMLVKCFAIDLALFFRHCCPLRSHNKDSRMYDAYVVYQMQGVDKMTEDSLCQFVTTILPSVLEEKCGYRLFIHGRDDIPGEDRLELVEDRMKQSRRLMVILPPGSGSGPEITDQRPSSPQNPIGGFDWQVGLHHALLLREISVIVIQLGDTGPDGYARLPPGLRHLIRKRAPIRWREGSRGAVAWNSRFWKRVRYLMPATPAKKCPQLAII